MRLSAFIGLFRITKQAYSNILRMLLPKKWKLSDKNSGSFHISAQKIDCRYSTEPPRRDSSAFGKGAGRCNASRHRRIGQSLDSTPGKGT